MIKCESESYYTTQINIYHACARTTFSVRREYKLPRHSSWTCACKQTDLEKMIENSVIKITKVERKTSTLLILSGMRDS